jgi:hypothetical protein
MLLAQVCFRSLSSELSLERFDSRFRPFGAGIINEVLLARHTQASTIPIIRTSASSLSCSLRPFTRQLSPRVTLTYLLAVIYSNDFHSDSESVHLLRNTNSDSKKRKSV